MEIGKLVIPGVSVSKMRSGGKEVYYVYIPQRFNKYLSHGKWNITVIVDDKEIPIGFRSVFRHGTYFIVTLPINLRYLWEEYLGKEIDLVLEKF